MVAFMEDNLHGGRTLHVDIDVDTSEGEAVLVLTAETDDARAETVAELTTASPTDIREFFHLADRAKQAWEAKLAGR